MAPGKSRAPYLAFPCAHACAYLTEEPGDASCAFAPPWPPWPSALTAPTANKRPAEQMGGTAMRETTSRMTCELYQPVPKEWSAPAASCRVSFEGSAAAPLAHNPSPRNPGARSPNAQ